MKKPELLAPAGDYTKLCYAVEYGADAVYIGGEEFSLRTAAKNFSAEDMQKGVRYAHARGVRVYVACNTVPRNDEMMRFPEYLHFLEDIGYKVFFKNINLNYSVGKVRWRPWAERGGRIATNTTTFNREILIVEKANDGKPFELHTSYDDKEKYYRNLRNPWLFLLLMFALFAVTKQSIIFGIFALVSIIPGSIYQIQIMKIRKEAKTQEW